MTPFRSGGRFRLLPPIRELGWTPFAWLIYLPTLVLEPFWYHRPAWQLALTLVGATAFLVSYFLGYWTRGRALVGVAAFQAALGVALAPVNTGSSVLFVYAAGFAGQLPRQRDAVRALAAIALLAAATSWTFAMPWYFAMVAGAFSLLIGGVNLHFSQVSRANHRLRLAQDEIAQLATVAERERIARDLHDLLGHTLSLVTLKAELAAKLVDRDPARATREMREVERVSREAMQEVREAIRGYRPTLDDEIGRARTLLVAAGIAAEVSAEPVSLPRDVDEALALAVREGATNVVRHANATRCTITLRSDDSSARLTIADDGTAGAAAEGSGLRGMRERVEALGGTVARERRGGTRLSVVLPAAGRAESFPAPDRYAAVG